MNVLLPAGNFATGMAWSHFQGYLKHMLPGRETLWNNIVRYHKAIIAVLYHICILNL